MKKPDLSVESLHLRIKQFCDGKVTAYFCQRQPPVAYKWLKWAALRLKCRKFVPVWNLT